MNFYAICYFCNRPISYLFFRRDKGYWEHVDTNAEGDFVRCSTLSSVQKATPHPQSFILQP